MWAALEVLSLERQICFEEKKQSNLVRHSKFGTPLLARRDPSIITLDGRNCTCAQIPDKRKRGDQSDGRWR
jgi:hypothetical protein